MQHAGERTRTGTKENYVQCVAGWVFDSVLTFRCSSNAAIRNDDLLRALPCSVHSYQRQLLCFLCDNSFELQVEKIEKILSPYEHAGVDEG